MAEQLITLRPNRGAEIDVDGTTYHLGLDTDWGEAQVDASLLEGPDITGAVAGTRRLLTRDRSLVIQIRASTGSAYLTAAEALAACVSNLQRYGGVIVRQLELGGSGDYSEALECEILEAGLSEAEDGWLEATRLHGEVVLSLTTQPQWLADWEEAASVEANAESLIECPVDALRGNLPGPGRIVFTDHSAAGARTNLVTNPSFETNATGWAALGAGVTATRVTTDSYEGTASLEVVTPGTVAEEGVQLSPDLTAPTVGEVFTASAYVKFPAGKTIRAYLTETGVAFTTADVVATGRWQRISVTRTMVGGGTGLDFRIFEPTQTAAITFHVDAVLVEESATLGVYFDGTSTGAWTGAAHASTSTKSSVTAVARRFVELGGAFENFTAGQQTEFRAYDFSLTGADGTLSSTAVTDKIGPYTISVTPVLPAWTTIGFLEDLPQSGTHNVRARVLCEDEDVTVTVRALWRSGSGAWKELDSAEIPADGWHDLPLGTISHYDEADTIDVRFDVRATEVTSSTFRLNIATVTATDLYVLAVGSVTEGVPTGAAGFDAMSADVTTMASRSAQLGGAWTAFGSNDQFTVDLSGWQERFYEDASLTAGRGYVLNGLSATATQTVGVSGKALAAEKNSNSIFGAVFRYVDASNFGLCVLRHRRTAGGEYLPYVTVYKVVAGTITKIKQKSVKASGLGVTGSVHVSVAANGTFDVFAEMGVAGQTPVMGDLLFSGSDSAFVTAGTLDDGKMGFYGASTSNNNELRVYGFVGYGDTVDVVTADVIRDGGTGEITYAQAFSADLDGTDPQPVSSAEGRRPWFSPGLPALLTAKVRTSDSIVEVDTGHSNPTDLTVYHRPAFATLSDSLE